MKNILFLLGMTAILLFATCKDPKNESPATCTITAPAKDAEFNLDDEINVVVTANDDNGVIAQVQLYIDNEGYGSITNFPYNFTIPAETLKAGAHIIKAVAISNSGNKGEDIVSITVKNTFTECANFETFNGSSTELPKGWQAEGWYIDETMGYDDNYSLACETPKAWALTAKTVSENITAIEFYLKGDGTVSFFVDDKEVTCRQSQEWQRYIFYVNEGTHQFKWVYNLGGKMNIDAVSFKKSLAVGMPYQGGIIAYLDETNEHGFIAASEDQSSGIIWAKNNETETSALDKMIGGGKSNTEKIIAALGEGSYAAQLCNDLIIDGYDDWYLPTDCEIDELYINRIIIGNFSSASYWSSLEYVAGKDIFRTMSMKFDELGMKAYGDEREWNHRVRAIRYF